MTGVIVAVATRLAVVSIHHGFQTAVQPLGEAGELPDITTPDILAHAVVNLTVRKTCDRDTQILHVSRAASLHAVLRSIRKVPSSYRLFDVLTQFLSEFGSAFIA
jgi:hypothetical protein